MICFLLSLILLGNVVLAQQSAITDTSNILNNVLSIISPYWGIIFLAIFVLILLIIGGVWRPSAGGMNLTTIILFIIVIVILFFVPQYIAFPDYMKVVPDSFKYWQMPEPAKDVLQFIGLTREWGYVPAIIYLFILPFAAIFTLFWAFLDTLAIFTQANVKTLLALIVSFMTIPLGWFTRMVWVLFAFMGIWSLAIFAAMFVLGVFFRGAGHVAKEYNTLTKYSKYKKDADKFDAYVENRLGDLMKHGVRAESIKGLRDWADDMETNIRGGGANYDGAKSEFEKMISKK